MPSDNAPTSRTLQRSELALENRQMGRDYYWYFDNPVVHHDTRYTAHTYYGTEYGTI